jgi:hypothetical protein
LHVAGSSREMRVDFYSNAGLICGIVLAALLKENIAYQYVGHLPEHQRFIDHYCKARWFSRDENQS